MSSTASLNGSLILAGSPAGNTDSVLVLNAGNQVGSRTIDSRVWGSTLIDSSDTHPAMSLVAGSTNYLSLVAATQVLSASAIDLSTVANTTGILGVAKGGIGIDGSTAPSGTLVIGTGTGYNIKSMGGDATIDSTGTFTLANSGVTAATYGSSLGIPTLTIDAKGRITAASTSPLLNIIDGSGIASYVARFTDTNTLTTGVLSDDGVNVGIGTLSSLAKLDVRGAIRLGDNALQGNTLNTSPSTSAPSSSLYFGSRTLLDDVNIGNYVSTTISSANGGLTLSGATGPVTLTLDATTTGTTSTTASNSGLEITADGLRLVGGCSSNEVLSWDATLSVWKCASVTGIGGVTGNGVATRLAFWDSSSNLASSQSLYWDNTNLRLGIGTSAPLSTLDVNGTANIAGALTVTGNILPNADDTYDLGSSSLRWKDIYLGPTSLHIASTIAETQTARDWKLGIEEANGASEGFLRLQEGSNQIMAFDPLGNVGIGTTAPTYQLELSTDSAAKPTSNAWTVVSDARLKENILAFSDGLSILNQINPVNYTLNGKAGTPAGAQGIGVIAQDVMNIIPYTVKTFNGNLDGTDTQLYSFNSSALTFVTINAVKELSTKLDSNGDVISNLGQTTNERLSQIDFRLNALTNQVESVNEVLGAQQTALDMVNQKLSSINSLLGITDETSQSTQTSQSSESSGSAGATRSFFAVQILSQIESLYNEFKDALASLGLSNNSGTLTVSADMNVLGNATFNDITVTGDLFAGQLKLDGLNNAIEINGPECYNETTLNKNVELCNAQTIFLQKGLAGNIDIFNGKVVIEPDGVLTVNGTINADKVSTKEFIVKQASEMIGSATIAAGGTSIVINSTKVRPNSKIFITATSGTGGQALIVSDKSEGVSFTASLDSAISQDITFDWWIISVE